MKIGLQYRDPDLPNAKMYNLFEVKPGTKVEDILQVIKGSALGILERDGMVSKYIENGELEENGTYHVTSNNVRKTVKILNSGKIDIK